MLLEYAYFQNILDREQSNYIDYDLVLRNLSPHIREWANKHFNAIHPSGSYAKGTSNKQGADIDLLISLNAEELTLQEIYDSLFTYFKKLNLNPIKQNVSINIQFQNKNIDLVPARLHKSLLSYNDHSIFKAHNGTWTKTNIQKQIAHVRNSNCQEAIRLIKIWRDQKGFDFSSFYLELFVIEAMQGKTFPLSQIRNILEYLKDHILDTRIVDPGNMSNFISEEYSLIYKLNIKNAAKEALAALSSSNWENFIR